MTTTGSKGGKLKEFGDTLRFLREQAGHSVRAVADFAGCSPNDYSSWEAGLDVPDNRRWSRLCIMNRQLQRYRLLWQDALGELRAKPLAAPLGDKLAAIKPVVMVPAKPAVDPMAQAVLSTPKEPEAPKPVTLDTIRPLANEAVRNLPEGWRNAENVKERDEYAREAFRKDPTLTGLAVAAMQKEKFGVSTHRNRLGEIKAKVMAEQARAAKKAAKEQKPTAAPAPKAPTTEEIVAAATELLMEAIPNLASFTLTVSEAGEAQVAYKTRKVVEEGGTITVGVKK